MYLREAFKALEALNEDTFSVSDDGIQKLSEFEQNDDLIDDIPVIDLEAETEDDLQDSYVGKVILDCTVCHSKIYKDKSEVTVDDNVEFANVGEECPYCYTSDGFKIIGEVTEYGDEEEKVETDKTDDEDTEEDNKIEESLNSKDLSEATEFTEPELLGKGCCAPTATLPSERELRGIFKSLNSTNPKEKEWAKDDLNRLIERIKDIKQTFTNFDEYWKIHYQTALDAMKLLQDTINKELGDDTVNEFLDANVTLDARGFGGKDNNVSVLGSSLPMGESFEDGKDFRTDSSAHRLIDNFLGWYREMYDDEETVRFLRRMDLTDEEITYYTDIDTTLYEGIFDRFKKKKTSNPNTNNKKQTSTVKDGFVVAHKDKIDNRFEWSNESGFKVYSQRDEAQDYADTKNSNGDSNRRYEVITVDQARTLFGNDIMLHEDLDSDASPFDFDGAQFIYDGDGISSCITFKVQGKKDKIVIKSFCDLSGDRDSRVVSTYEEAAEFVNDVLTEYGEAGDDWEELGWYLDESKSMNESVNNVNVETDDSVVNVSTDDTGKVTVTTEPNTNTDKGDEVLAPLSDETEQEIVDNSFGEDEEFTDVDVEEFDEESFDELGESYLKNIYENVDSYKTSKVTQTDNKIKVEGVIKFTSGASKNTTFLFEAKDVTKSGVVRFIGENVNITKGVKAFTIKGNVNNKKFITESFNYNYKTKKADGTLNRVFGTLTSRKG